MSDFSKKYQDYLEQLSECIEIHERIIQQLRSFLLQQKEVQGYIFSDLFTSYLKTERLLEDIIYDEVNRDTVREHDSEIDEMVRKEQEDFYGDSKTK